MPCAANSVARLCAAPSPSQLVSTRLAQAPWIRCASTRATTASRGTRCSTPARSGNSSPAWHPIAGDCSSTSSARRIALGSGVADDVDRIGVRPRRRQHRVERGTSSRRRARRARRPRSASRSAASTPAPPPLVRIVSRSPSSRGVPRQHLGGVEQFRRVRSRAAGRRAGTRHRRRHPPGQRAGVRQRRPRRPPRGGRP